ncbi:uncharacterized protein LOC119197571 [Pungitius pungitius]|uniref:uncharacterized protein LOC119197571 n=1 Tax=Pungitius pungitius TaxID=134920 RepID=UPI002E16402B
MEKEPTFFGVLTKDLSKRPLLANVLLGFIQTGLEKLMEVEFQCPCEPIWNKFISSAFFILPALFTFILMLIIQIRASSTWFKKTMFSFGPAIVWLILLFFDGRYFACAMTTWKGRYVKIKETTSLNWCEPTGNVTSSEKLMSRSQDFYALSQFVGIILFCCISVGLIINQVVKCIQAQDVTQPGAGVQAQAQPGGNAQAQVEGMLRLKFLLSLEGMQAHVVTQPEGIAQAQGNLQVSDSSISQTSGGLTLPNTTATQDDTQHGENIALTEV